MPFRVLIVPDKFKGTLTARAAAELIAAGWRTVRPDDQLELLPMSDGGDGFGEVLSGLFEVQTRTTVTVDAAHRPRQAQWWWQPETRTAVIESAQVIGLALLPPGRFHPFALDTYGLGTVIRAAAELGGRRCLIGIGGSATNDGGFGVARALGWVFLNDANEAISSWTNLTTLRQLRRPKDSLTFPEVRIAVDVQNPLLGERGATRVYGPQKGIRPEDILSTEACLERLRQVVERDLEIIPPSMPGDGAAGGLGFGLRSFLGAELESGFTLFSRSARLGERIRNADLVITGEGAIDASTLMGKGVGEIAQLCRQHDVPCIGLAGTLDESAAGEWNRQHFTRLYGIVPQLTTPQNAKQDAALWLPRLAEKAASA